MALYYHPFTGPYTEPTLSSNIIVQEPDLDNVIEIGRPLKRYKGIHVVEIHASDVDTTDLTATNGTVTNLTSTTATIPTLTTTNATVTTGTVTNLTATDATVTNLTVVTAGTIPTLSVTTATIPTLTSTNATVTNVTATTATITTLTDLTQIDFKDSIWIGNGGGLGAGSIKIGDGSTTQDNCDVFGSSATANTGAVESTIIGSAANSYGAKCTCLGRGAIAGFTGGEECTALGYLSQANGNRSVAVGARAINNTSDTMVLGATTLISIRPTSTSCTLGTSAAPFTGLYLFGGRAQSVMFSGYSDVTVTNTTTETSLFPATFTGTLTAPANLPLGSLLSFRIFGRFNGVKDLGDTVWLRLKSNGGILLPLLVNLDAQIGGSTQFELRFDLSVRNGAAQIHMHFEREGQGIFYESTFIVFDRTIANAFDVTVEWGSADAGNLITETMSRVDVFTPF